MDTNNEENIINGASSPILPLQSEMDIFLEEKAAQKELKQQKIYQIKQAKISLSNIIKIKFNEQIQHDLLEGINYLDFLIQKIRNPLIQSPKHSALNELNSKILELNIKLDSIHLEKNIQNQTDKNINNNNKFINFPPSPLVVIPKINKEVITLEDSIYNNNGFQEVKSKKKNQLNNINNNTENNINNKSNNIKNQKDDIINQKPTLLKKDKNLVREKQREKRLILQVPKEFIDNLAPFSLRNEINRSFENNNVKKPIIASITKS